MSRDDDVYQPLKPSHAMRREIRGVNYFVRTWGAESAPPLIMLHGTRDTSVTFQFVIDAMAQEWRVIVPDWRGHGHTVSTAHAWFHDYLADLDALLEWLFPAQAVDIVGHSLGGNVASVYAGLRPDRVRRLVSLDAFGINPLRESEFPDLLLGWLDGAHAAATPPTYRSIAQMAEKLCSSNRRLSPDKAVFLALNLSRPVHGGGFTWQFDVARRRSMPTFHSLGEWVACWQRITARKLWVAAADPMPGTVRSNAESFAFVSDHIDPDSLVFLPDTGHNLQHDSPLQLAGIIERFLSD
jgi:pimeloyl-ACP methyl ester carboxylesterase